jgi:PBP1b-binding outer membrane lipoprotein LpoB
MFKKILPTITLTLIILTGCQQQPPIASNPPIEPPTSSNNSPETNQSAEDYSDTFLLKIGAAMTEDIPSTMRKVSLFW